MPQNTQLKKSCEPLYSFLEEYRALLLKYNYTIDSEDGCLIDAKTNQYIGYVELEDTNNLQLFVILPNDDGTEEKLILNV